MSEHTPLPWEAKFVPAQPSGMSTYEIVRVGCDVAIATVHYPGLPLEADAEFIVRAVNSHDDLLAALEGAQWGTEELCPSCGAFSQDGHGNDCGLASAIAKAKGPA